jgi:CHAT domain-containing protein
LNSVLKELSTRIWRPIAAALPDGVTNIIVSPDSQLNFVSFAALLQSNGRFVAEDFAISYISTARDLLEQNPPLHSGRTLAVWASPEFSDARCQDRRAAPNHEPVPAEGLSLAVSRAAAVRELRGLQLNPLEGARREGEELKRNATRFGFIACQTFMGADATEAQLRRISAPRVLHLATHGFFLPQIAESAASNSGKTADSRIRVRLANNPMLRSGIALAGAQGTIEAWKRGEYVPAENDGIVTAEEVASLDLRDTSLVVLSACDSGGGEALAGEGVLGLRRGFIQAGAGNLVVALWSVDDKTTADFFLDFYNSLGAGLSPANALSQTQAQWLRRYRLEKGVAAACQTVGPFVLNTRGCQMPGRVDPAVGG